MEHAFLHPSMLQRFFVCVFLNMIKVSVPPPISFQTTVSHFRRGILWVSKSTETNKQRTGRKRLEKSKGNDIDKVQDMKT
jgi:hypothetical protein